MPDKTVETPEKMEAFKVCAPCSLAAQSPALSASTPPPLSLLCCWPLHLSHSHTHIWMPLLCIHLATMCCLVDRRGREGQDARDAGGEEGMQECDQGPYKSVRLQVRDVISGKSAVPCECP